MKIKTQELKAALDRLAPIVSRGSLPILSCLKIEACKGRLEISASNLDEYATEKIEADGKFNPVCVSFRYLFLSIALAGGETEISNEGKNVVIRSGSNVTTLATMAVEEFPAFPALKNTTKHGLACNEVASHIKSVLWAASNDVARYILNSVLVHSSAKEKKLRLVATNGRELAVHESGLIRSDAEFVIPSGFAVNLSAAMTRGGAMVATDDRLIQVDCESSTYICRQVEGKYPNWKNVVPGGVKLLGAVSVEEIRDVMASIAGYAEKSEGQAVFKFSKTAVDIEFVGNNGTVLTRQIAGKFASLTIALSSVKMLSIFRNIKEENAELFFVDELSPLKIVAGDLMVLTTPMRLT